MKKLTTKDFISKSKNIHVEKYDYSLTVYVNAKTKVKIICKEHDVFEISPNNHISKKQGCVKCSNIKLGNKIRKNSSEFIFNAKTVHGDRYDYSKVLYMKNTTHIEISCKEHGIFKQIPKNHLLGHGCTKCKIDKIKSVKTKSIGDVISESKIVHGDRYDYSKVEYVNNNTKVKIICKEHGIFEQAMNKHINSKQGCPCCFESSSKGEIEVINFLIDNDIDFKKEKSFDNCVSNKNHKLRFDFYLPENNICIEYDGVQHYKIIDFFGGRSGFMKLKNRDKVKNKYCINNEIKLIRIPYFDFKKIDEILKKELL